MKKTMFSTLYSKTLLEKKIKDLTVTKIFVVVVILFSIIIHQSAFAQCCNGKTTWTTGMWIGPNSSCGSPYGGDTVSHNGRLYTYNGTCSNTGPGTPGFVDVGACTISSGLTAGTIGSAQNICTGSTPSTLTNITSPTGGTTYTYQWQSSTDSINWNNISGATSITYSPGPLTSSIYYRRTASSPCKTPANSAGIFIKVDNTNSVFKSSALGTDSQTVCINIAIGTIQYIFNGSGINGVTVTGLPTNFTYIYANSPAKAINIDGASANTGIYSYTVTSTGGVCPAVSVSGIITILPNTVANAGTDQAQCNNGTFTISGSVPPTGTGNWTIVSGTGTITNPTSRNTTVTGVTAGSSVTLRWTIVNCNNATYFDDVILSNGAVPTTANASIDQARCNISSFTLNGNTPTIGAGVWSKINGTGTITNPTTSNTTVTGVNVGTSTTLTWTISSGSCASTDTVILTNIVNSLTANAGADITQCNDSVFTLIGNTPPAGATGLWTVAAGNATITNPNSITTTAHLIVGQIVTFKWRITTIDGCAAEDYNVYRNNALPVQANAGDDQVNCTNPNFSIGGNQPNGTGTWTKASGTGTIANPTSQFTTFTGVNVGTSTTLIWTISNGCGATSDTVILTNSSPPTIANAGVDQIICNTPTFNLNGNTPTIGTGIWRILSGTATIVSPNSPTSQVTNVTAGTSVTLRWTISNGNCTVSNDDVILTNNALSTTANAGVDQGICNTSTFTLAGNAPSPGAGVWAKVSGTGTITTPTSRTSGVTGVTAGTSITLKWTISNGTCTSSTDTVILTNYASPTTANAGTQQNKCKDSIFTLAGNTPTIGTGVWSVVSGTGTIVTPTSSTSTVYVPAGKIVTVRWTTSNGNCATTFDGVTLRNGDTIPTTANAGPDVGNCQVNTFTLNGNAPTIGTGIWAKVSGPGTITNTALRNSTVTSVTLNGGSAVLTWTISNGGGCRSTDTVSLINVSSPTNANAGAAQNNCNNSTFTLTGNTPSVGTGTWTLVTGTATIVSPNSPTSQVTGVIVGTSVTLRWSISNGYCTSATSDVILTNNALPTTASAGADQTICSNSTFTLNGNAPTVGTGVWSLVSGTATIITPTSRTTQVTGVALDASVTLRWTISNGACTSIDTVVLTNVNASSFTVNAGADQVKCNDSTFTLNGNTPATGTTGTWTIVSGTGSITTASSNTSTVTGVSSGASITLRWNISNGICTSTDDVILTNNATPTNANAGVDQNKCNDVTFILGGNNPSTGTGLWTVVSGLASIAAPSSRTSAVTVNVGTSATLSWTISNGSCISADSVILTNNAIPTTANAGINQNNCSDSIFTLAGNAPTVGTGVWSLVSGTATIITPTSRTTQVTGVALDASVTLRWTISNGACTSTTDDVTLTNINNFVYLASAIGTDSQIVCINKAIGAIQYQFNVLSGITGATVSPLPTNVTRTYNNASKTVGISGTATVLGTYNYTVTTTGGKCNTTATGTIIVVPNRSAGVASSSPVLSVNTPLTPIRHSTVGTTGIQSPNGLPQGLSASFNNDTITISGTPIQSGNFNYDIALIGNCGPIVVSATGNIQVCPTVNGTVTGSKTVCTGTNSSTLNIGGQSGSVTRWEKSLDSFATPGTSIFNTGTSITENNLTATTYYRAVITNGSCVVNSTVATIKVTPNNSITRTSAIGTVAQTICKGNPITKITYLAKGANTPTVTNLPQGVSYTWVADTLTISGTPLVSGATLTYTVSITGGCGSTVTTTGTIAVLANNWLGGVSSSWKNAANWSCGIIPNGSSEIIISSGTPILDTNITIQANQSLVLSGTGSLAIEAGKSLTIAGTANFGGKLVTLKSDATGTASIGQITGTLSNATNITVERYIPANGRRYRYLASPVVGGTSLQWRDNAGSTAGRGTHITGPIGTTDYSLTPQPSAFKYTESLSTATNINECWEAIDGNTALANGTGYRVFIRGDRSISLTTLNTINNATTLWVNGTYPSGTRNLPVSYTAGKGDGWNLVGNPYPCTIDYEASSGWAKTNMGSGVAIYKPSTNSYAYSLSSGGSNPSNLTINGGSQYIASGQAFFVKANGAGAPSLTCTEAVKVTNQGSPINLFKGVPANQLRLTLKQDSSNIDETLIAFAATNKDAFDNNEDIAKIPNANVNISTVVGTEKYAAINLTSNNYKEKVMPLSVWSNKNGNLQLSFSQLAGFDAGVTVFLKDKFLNTTTAIDQDKTINISLADNSKGDNRFELVFKNSNTNIEQVLVSDAQLAVYPNPAIDVLNISISNASFKNSNVTITNVSGQELINTNMSGTDKQINIEGLSSGIYFVNITNENGFNKTVKFVK